MPYASLSNSTSTLMFHSFSSASKYSTEVCSIVGGAAPCGNRFAVGSFEGRDTSDWGKSVISQSFEWSHAMYIDRFTRSVGSARRQIIFELSACIYPQALHTLAITITIAIAGPLPPPLQANLARCSQSPSYVSRNIIPLNHRGHVPSFMSYPYFRSLSAQKTVTYGLYASRRLPDG